MIFKERIRQHLTGKWTYNECLLAAGDRPFKETKSRKLLKWSDRLHEGMSKKIIGLYVKCLKISPIVFVLAVALSVAGLIPVVIPFALIFVAIFMVCSLLLFINFSLEIERELTLRERLRDFELLGRSCIDFVSYNIQVKTCFERNLPFRNFDDVVTLQHAQLAGIKKLAKRLQPLPLAYDVFSQMATSAYQILNHPELTDEEKNEHLPAENAWRETYLAMRNALNGEFDARETGENIPIYLPQAATKSPSKKL